ncbi:MAG: hypothetical protein JW775_06765, partial [Candidatus Aminicenantes bacterium]|nr:hypothetical protein [Candidatus Aminicenantes bacterium]
MKAKTISSAVILVTLAVFMAVPASAGPIPSSLVPEGARWIVHLDMEKFVGTSLYGYLEKEDAFRIKSRDIDRWLKMDIARDVKSLTVFGLGPGDNDIVFAVSGKLDKAGIVAMVEADKDHQAAAYGAYTLYSSGSDEHSAFVNDSLIV